MEAIDVYYNPSCSKCIYAVDFLRSQGIEPNLIQYLTESPDFSTLKILIQKLGLNANDLLRRSEPFFIDNYKDIDLNDDELIQCMVEYPILIQRPVLVKGNFAKICRDEKSLMEFISH